MAGIGKNPRHGKRPPSSTSSYFSTLTMVVLVAFCLIGVWMLTSSSSTNSQATTTHLSRAAKPLSSRFLKDALRTNEPEQEEEDKPGTKILEEKEESQDQSQQDETQEEQSQQDEQDATQEEQSQQDEQLRRPQHDEQQMTAGDRQQQETNAAGDQQQETNAAGDQQQLDGGEEQQQQDIQQGVGETQQQQLETQSGEENQQQTAQEAHDEQQPIEIQSNESLNQQQTAQEAHDEQQPLEIQSNESLDTQVEENQQDTQQQQEQGGIDFENQQQTQQSQGEAQEQQAATEDIENQQQQETGSNIDANQQEDQAQQKIEEETKLEIDENHDRIEPHIEEVTSESNDTQQQPENEGQQQSDDKFTDNPNSNDLLPDAGQSEVPNNGDSGSKKRAWATQADQSENQKERQMGEQSGYEWELCNVTAGPDYIPCLDNEKAIRQLHIKHYEHRERHCPEESPSCLVPLPNGYRHSIEWPRSRDKIWYNNVPHTKLAEVKGHQNWVKVTGEYLTFPGGGTQFIHGALHYIDFIQQSVHDIAWGKHTRVVLDVGCGVASFGGFLFERDVLTMSFAPKDEHEAQVQLALERGIPAMSAVMGSQRLPFPSRVFDLVHCARCRVPWHADGGMLLLELNRVLRPGGYFVWSATPVYQRLKEDVEIWKAMKSLTVSMCWDLISIKKDKLNSVGAAFFRKPVSNECYDNRKLHSPPMCKEDDDPNAAWYIPLKTCMHRVPVDASERGSKWPEQWPQRLQLPPYWLNSSQIGVYGKPAPDDFQSDYEHWKRVVTKSYLTGFGINWSKVRNVMDMRAVYGGFSAALRDLKVWSLNVVNIDSPDTLPIIYERGLFGIYHDWCESFSTYPRTYDLLHADHLFSNLKKRCKIVPALAEVDRIVRPGGKLIVRDESRTITEVENLLKSLHWEVHLTFSKDQEGILCAEKSDWRPEKFSDSA